MNRDKNKKQNKTAVEVFRNLVFILYNLTSHVAHNHPEK